MASDKATARVAALIKAKSNSRCFDCAAPGASTQAVLAPLGIFVCTTCGGIHRELQHHVKGVSMSAFKDEEVARSILDVEVEVEQVEAARKAEKDAQAGDMDAAQEVMNLALEWLGTAMYDKNSRDWQSFDWALVEDCDPDDFPVA